MYYDDWEVIKSFLFSIIKKDHMHKALYEYLSAIVHSASVNCAQ